MIKTNFVIQFFSVNDSRIKGDKNLGWDVGPTYSETRLIIDKKAEIKEDIFDEMIAKLKQRLIQEKIVIPDKEDN